MSYLTLSQFLTKFKQFVDDNFRNKNFWVVAEIAKMTINQKKHCFLELIEKDENSPDSQVKAQINGIIWSSKYDDIAKKFLNATGENLREGLKILFDCEISFHQVYGLKIFINDIKPEFTVGEMFVKKEEIIERLRKEDLLDKNKSLSLPIVIQKIAIISSTTSAGLEDFINHLNNNPYKFKFSCYVLNSIMQGNDARGSIVNALEKIKKHKDFFDTVVIIRGGGSKVDLNCFDNFELAKFIAEFPLPVITGIGHTKDISCVDLVAHNYLKTPTACAEFIVEKANSFYSNLISFSKQMSNSLQNLLVSCNYRVSDRSKTIEFITKNLLESFKSKIDSSVLALTQNTQSSLHQHKSKIKNISFLLYDISKILPEKLYIVGKISTLFLNNIKALFIRENSKLREINSKVNLLNPKNVLKRGYSITYYKDKSITTIKKLRKNVQIVTKLYKGIILSEVKQKFP